MYSRPINTENIVAKTGSKRNTIAAVVSDIYLCTKSLKNVAPIEQAIAKYIIYNHASMVKSKPC